MVFQLHEVPTATIIVATASFIRPVFWMTGLVHSENTRVTDWLLRNFCLLGGSGDEAKFEMRI